VRDVTGHSPVAVTTNNPEKKCESFARHVFRLTMITQNDDSFHESQDNSFKINFACFKIDVELETRIDNIAEH
jgi:hypothetical protein